jgi:hypothetical protein
MRTPAHSVYPYQISSKSFFHNLFALILSVVLLSSCASARQALNIENKSAPPREMPAAAPQAPAYDAAGGVTASESGPAPTSQVSVPNGGPQKRLVVKNANLTLVVQDPPKAMDAISKMAQEMDGFVVSADLSQTELENGVKIPQATITFRIPADKLDTALKQLKAMSDRLPISEKISSQDVTADYVDQQSRLRNLEATEVQLTKIMSDTYKTDEVLSVYSQLTQVRQQIEVTKGQIQYYEQSAALSSVTVELLANAAVQPLTIGSWQPAGVAKDAVQTLINTLKGIVNVVIWLVIYILPVLLVLYVIFILPLSLLWRSWRRRRAARKAAAMVTPVQASTKKDS